MSSAERHHQDSEPATMRTARVMIQAGYRPIPIYPGKKKPMGEDWGVIRHLPEKWRDPAIGLGGLLGDDGSGHGLVDLDIDDPVRAVPVMERMFPDGLPDTPCFQANLGMHYVFAYDRRLAKYGLTRVFGLINKEGKLEGNRRYLGIDLRIGTFDPSHPEQVQSVLPPTPRTDGQPRQWLDRNGDVLAPEHPFLHSDLFLPLPDSVFADLDRYANASEDEDEEREPTWDKEEVKAAILPHALGLAKEWGLRVVGSRATGKGFWLCRAIGREDAEPSAGFNEATGVYTDRKTGTDLSIFQLAIALGAFRDFPTAVNSLGRRFGVPARNPATKATEGGSNKSQRGPYVAYVADSGNFHEEPVTVRPWPDPPAEESWYGLAGDLAKAIGPLTEADPIAILVQILAAFGSVIGRCAHARANATRHFTNLFLCTAGPSGVGRKGTAWDIVRELLHEIDPEWVGKRILGGLTSGEGLISAVRDPVELEEDRKEKGVIVGRHVVLKDPGESDKRLLAVETEFGRTLKVLSREGNILDGVIRQAWDSGNLGTMVRTNPLRATDAHVSIVGHITEGEACRYLTENQATNGFANRFLWVCVRRSKLLPRGATIDFGAPEWRPMVDRFSDAVATAREPTYALERTTDAEALWESVYEDLTSGQPGVLGVVTSRGDAQALRLSCLYALLDGLWTVKVPHLRAALALWDYCRRSASYIFGDALGDRDADHLLSSLRSAPDGISQADIVHHVFQRHKNAKEVARILGRLLEYGFVRSESQPTDGRPKTIWFARKPAT